MREIEQYRKVNQGPLLQRTSDLFATLTDGSFAEVQTDFDDRDQLVLVGVRPGGERVPVSGLSSGTRDQLFFALKLSALERSLESSESMPFWVDDVLVHFDERRSLA